MKACLGNFLLKECDNHSKCEVSGLCSYETNIRRGVCDCKYKGSCHTSRQFIQQKFSEDEGISQCWFYNKFASRRDGEMIAYDK